MNRGNKTIFRNFMCRLCSSSAVFDIRKREKSHTMQKAAEHRAAFYSITKTA